MKTREDKEREERVAEQKTGQVCFCESVLGRQPALYGPISDQLDELC